MHLLMQEMQDLDDNIFNHHPEPSILDQFMEQGGLDICDV